MTVAIDIGIFNYGQVLARAFGLPFVIPRKDLPAFYQLELPDSPGIEDYEPPPGFTSTYRGMWLDNPVAWTWPLEVALRVLAKATDCPPSILRRRAGELMRRDGGRRLFGPEPVNAQHDRLTRLELKLLFRRLEVVAAFRAAREVAAEFAAAGRFDWSYIELVAFRTGAASLGLTSFFPTPRPAEIVRPAIAKLKRSGEIEAWLNDDETQPTWPSAPGRVILASVYTFERTSVRETYVEEGTMLHVAGSLNGPNLSAALCNLPRSVALNSIYSTYRGISPAGITFLDDGVSASVPDNAIAFCPNLAATLGLNAKPEDPWTYYNDRQEPLVQTIWWRDGGLKRIDIDRSISGSGFVVSVAAELWPNIESLIETGRTIQLWRSHTSNGETTKAPFPNGRVIVLTEQ
ncbi:MAG: hypothetical protein P4M07_09930 [Xanthobacteraceae bacterium]|nr:hypothetical protein [Xanthobacteraceae bacterium]